MNRQGVPRQSPRMNVQAGQAVYNVPPAQTTMFMSQQSPYSMGGHAQVITIGGHPPVQVQVCCFSGSWLHP